MNNVQVIPVKDMGLIQKGDALAQIIVDRLGKQNAAIEDDDCLVITSKVVSKAAGRIIPLSTVEPSADARALATVAGRDPKICELIIRNSKKIQGIVRTGDQAMHFYDQFPESFPVGRATVETLFRKEPTMILAEVYNGLMATDAGIDCSNVEGTENAILLPEDADASCRALREDILKLTGKTTAVIISDTDIRFQRFGSVDQAIGSWGIETIAPHFGQKDLYGKPKIGGVDAISDMVSIAASLVMGNTDEAIPAAIVRGVRYRRMEKGMAPIHIPGKAVAEGVFYNILYDIQYYWHLLRERAAPTRPSA